MATATGSLRTCIRYNAQRLLCANMETQVIRVNSKNHGPSVISTVTYKGRGRRVALGGALYFDILLDFLRRLIKDAGRKIPLIFDNQRVHHSNPVQAWLTQH